MKKDNKNIAEEVLQEMNKLKSQVKENSKDIISSFLSDAAKEVLREEINETDDNDDEEKDYEVIDADNNLENGDETDSEDANSNDEEKSTEDDSEEGDSEDSNESEDGTDDKEDEWSQFDKYKVGEDEYDLTGVKDDETVVKVYKLLKDSDNVVVKKDGEKVKIEDKETGAEYVIDLDDESDSGENKKDETSNDVTEGRITELDVSPDFYSDVVGAGGEYSGEDDDDLRDLNSDSDIADIDLDSDDDEESDEYDSDIPQNWLDDLENGDSEGEFYNKKHHKAGESGIAGLPNEKFESKKPKKVMKENKEVLFEIDLGYTDNYQDKDVIQGSGDYNVNEPSDKKTLDKVPEKTSKPWAGNAKSQGDPYKNQGGNKTVTEEEISEEEETLENVNEEDIDEGTNNTLSNVRKMSKSHTSNGKKTPQVPHVDSKAGEYNKKSSQTESVKKDLKKALTENKQLKEAVIKIKNALQEALVVNVNLGQFVKLVTENTTTQSEKVEILNRFNDEAKTIEQSKALYESIKRDLNKDNTKTAKINEGSITVNESKVNETQIYQSKEMMSMIDLMKRMGTI